MVSGELIEPNIVVFEVLGTNSESRMNVWMNVGEPSSNLTTIILVIEINIVEYLDECWNAARAELSTSILTRSCDLVGFLQSTLRRN